MKNTSSRINNRLDTAEMCGEFKDTVIGINFYMG